MGYFRSILCLILVVAAFNMTVLTLWLEKQKDISVLPAFALGGNKNYPTDIFKRGDVTGFNRGRYWYASGLTDCLVTDAISFDPLAGGLFLISYFPVKLRLMDFLLVGATVFVLH